MSEANHPPGPYRICDMRHQQRGNLKILSEPSIGIERDLGYVYASHPQADAVASLFIAAPDLLDVALLLEGTPDDPVLLAEIRKRGRAAISKAQGLP